MKNKESFVLTVSILLVSVLGCSSYNPLESSNSNSSVNDNRTLSEKTLDSTVGNEKIGIPECDEVVEFFADQAKSNDEDFVSKAARQFALSKIRESFRQSIEENKNDKAKLAKDCREFKVQLDRFKTEESNKSKN